MRNEADDDQDWLDLMAGRPAPGADDITRTQAEALRAAVLTQRLSAPAGAPAAADQRAERLLQRARAAGVLEDRLADVARPARAANRWPYAMAASVAVIGLLLVMQQQGPGDGSPAGMRDPAPEHEQMRGAVLQQRLSSQPLLDRQALLDRLRAAGFEAQPYERLGRLGIDVELPVPLPAARAAALKQLGLQPVTGPSLQIEILSTAPQPAHP
ncbi:hypothetical protein J7U46_13760 [Pelomonas sp. V22]|uniref:hypothetical protein n=1 Tax=Pelomonas sp. V22 TaxID=2822139 RepID=UPI0024A842CB|nr:hypothetical protein [Pelomonas sp. V22]MDI4634119.1 hypothetical protein [Pelomonas sp. V22]